MFSFRVIGFIAASVLLFGCYHATIDLGRTPSNVVIHETWAACWVFGLVPPSTVATASECPDGVAKVETQRSFLNSLVGTITLGIYSPIEIKVTCAAKSTALKPGEQPDFVLQEGSSIEETQEIYMKAAELAVSSEGPVFVEY